MTVLKYILRSLWFFRKQQLALLGSTILSTAILTGALIIGDSVKYSLKELVAIRLGETKFALNTGDRFIRTQLALDISDKLNIKASPILYVQGIGINPETNDRVNAIQVLGIDSSFSQFSNLSLQHLSDDEVVINEMLAQKLKLKQGDEILLRIENVSIIPLNAPFASQEQVTKSLRLKIKSVAGNDKLGRFSLKSNQAAPNNVFVSQKLLAATLELESLANLIIVSDNEEQNLTVEILNEALTEKWKLADASLKFRNIEGEGKLELISSRIFIEERISDAIQNLNIKNEPVLTYLVNAIRFDDKSTPYSFVSAVNSDLFDETIEKNEIIVNSWLADDLSLRTGDSIQLDYYIIGPLRTLSSVSQGFLVKKIIPIQNNELFRSLMPSFPGLSDAGHCRDWETGIPIDLDKIRDKDEDYWNKFKGIPKAYISEKYAQKIWKNQFGNLTAIRFDSSKVDQIKLEKELLTKLHPQDFNLVFQAVYEQGIAATENAVDFGELFLSLSFFIIVAALILTILIHSLNTESRSNETGILAGLGFSRKKILQIRLAEASWIVVLGGILGSFFGILYNYLILAGLNSVWNEVVRTNMITVFIKAQTLFIGSISGIIIAFLSIYFVNRKIIKQPIALLLKKSPLFTQLSSSKKTIMPWFVFFICLIAAIGLLAYSFTTSVESNAALFLSSGALFLVVCISYLNIYFNKKTKELKLLDINRLAFKNVGRNKFRSLTTITLLALGTYVVLITGASRQTLYGSENLNQSGTGGYLFWAETSLPVLNDLNSNEAKNEFDFLKEEFNKQLTISQFHSLDGDDASCLNLNQVQQPRVLGINENEFNDRKSFSFANLLNGIDKDNPWLSLNQMADENLIPAIADQTVLTWGLKKAIGDTLVYLNEEGKEINLLIVGGLNNSIFQGNLLISDSLFIQNFPSVSGSRVMLVDAPSQFQDTIQQQFSSYFADFGIELNKTTNRLAEFNSVTNTYLAVFMVLGGLAVLIGTIGLGIILLRSMLERKSEFALMLAIGYTKKQVFSVIFKENLFLLLTGLAIGILAAFIGILPSILSPSFEIQGTFAFMLLLLVLLNGVLWIYFPARNAVKANIIKSLREE